MKRIKSGVRNGVWKKVVSLVLAVALVAVLLPEARNVNAQDETGAESETGTEVLASTLGTGDTFTMGYWPQSEVTDEDETEALNDLDVEMVNYGYLYSDNSGDIYETLDMSYGDVTYNGTKYRKIYFTQYRPHVTIGSSLTSNSYQDNNEYYTGTVYWFKWEPVEWQVLDKESDGLYCMSTMLLDSQAYNNVHEDVTWETSTIRQ